jgi:hypothetical protein
MLGQESQVIMVYTSNGVTLLVIQLIKLGKTNNLVGADYKWSIDGSSSNFSKYTTTGATLELEDDAAHVNMGGSWHMPTPTQIQELIDCKYHKHLDNTGWRKWQIVYFKE